MGFLKRITQFFYFLYQDFKEDIKFLKDVTQGDRKIKYSSEELKEALNFKGFIKENWLWFLLLGAFFFTGIWWGSVIYQNMCNEFIYNNYLIDQGVNYTQMVTTSLGNWSIT